MALTKITDLELSTNGVVSLVDKPSESGVSASDLKAAFDKLVTDVVKVKFNALIDALEDTTDSASGADAIAATAIAVGSGTTVQAILEYLLAEMQSITQGAVADGSVTDTKLSADSTDIKARFATHTADLTKHIKSLGTTTGTGSAYITAGTILTSAAGLYLFKANADSALGATLTDGTTTKMLVPCGYASLEAGQIKTGGYYLMYYPASGSYFFILNPEVHSHTHVTGNINGLDTALSGKAASVHTHTQAQVTGLETALANKSDSDHTHTTLAAVQRTGDLASGSAGIVNIVYGTGDPPTASTVPVGTLYIKYTA